MAKYLVLAFQIEGKVLDMSKSKCLTATPLDSS